MLTQIEDARVLAGTPKFGGFDEEGSALSSEEEDLDEELIRMGRRWLGWIPQTKTPCEKKMQPKARENLLHSQTPAAVAARETSETSANRNQGARGLIVAQGSS